MIGLVLALAVVAIVLSLLGLGFVGIPIAIVGAVLLVVYLVGFKRRAAQGRP